MKSKNLMAIMLLVGAVVLSGCTAYQYQQTSTTPVGTPASTPPATQQSNITAPTAPPAQPTSNVTQPNATPSQPAAQPKTYSVSMASYSFSPATLTVKVGDTVIWTNNEPSGGYYGISHTVTSDSGSELNSPGISQGGTYSHTFNQAGTFSYHCSFHTYMKGTVVVQ